MGDFDAGQDSNYIMFFDVNNLYGYAMQKPLPYGAFKWLEDVERFDVQMTNENSDKGYILGVDLSYPESLHDLHSDFPFCPEPKKPPSSRCALYETSDDLTRQRKVCYSLYVLEAGVKKWIGAPKNTSNFGV